VVPGSALRDSLQARLRAPCPIHPQEGRHQCVRCLVVPAAWAGCGKEVRKTFAERMMALTAAERIQISMVPIQNGG
jgi:hypothetical protein